MVGKNNASILSQLVPLHLPQNSENERELKTKLSEGIEDTLLRNCQIPFVKRLESGEILGVKTWISYVITPGYVGCQLILKSQNGNLTIQFPTNWENYTKEEVIQIYDSIQTIDDWYGIQR